MGQSTTKVIDGVKGKTGNGTSAHIIIKIVVVIIIIIKLVVMVRRIQ